MLRQKNPTLHVALFDKSDTHRCNCDRRIDSYLNRTSNGPIHAARLFAMPPFLSNDLIERENLRLIRQNSNTPCAQCFGTGIAAGCAGTQHIEKNR